MNDLLSWLKRRRIARVALAYAVIGVGMLEGADVLAEALRLPSWAVSLVAYLVVLGFPLVLGLAWAFQPIPDQAGATGAEERGSSPHRRGRVLLSVGATLAMGAVIGAYVLLGPDGESSEPATDTGQPSIAVLPFANLSPDPENEYFSDGITEDLLTALTRISGVRVTSRTSSMAYKNSGKPLREIARELEVRYVLEGSVQRVDDDVRITAQLIDARDDSHLWAASYDRRLDRVFEIQSEITGRIADELRGHLSPDDRDRIAAARPADLRAYDLYLRGRQYTSRPGREITDDEAAIALFRQALAIDPEYAHAYAGLVSALVSNPGLAPGQRQDSALVLARRAVALDPRLPEARVALGDVLRSGGRLSEAAEHFQAVLDEDPRHVDALDGLAWTRALQGRLDEAIALTRRAARFDPLDGSLQNSLGWFHLRLGSLDDAARHFQAHLDLVPDAPGSRGNLAVVNLLRGDTARADDGALTLVERAAERVHTARTLGHYYLIRGNAEQALRWLERHREMAPQNAQYTSLALAARMAGRESEAHSHLARAEERVAAFRAGGLDPWFSEAEVSALRGDVAGAVAILERRLERGWRDYWLVSNGTEAVLAGVLHPLLSHAPEARLLLRRMRAELDGVRERMAP